jgi:hypothetical protein
MAEIQGGQYDGIYDPVAHDHSPEIPTATEIQCAKDCPNDRRCDYTRPPLIAVRSPNKALLDTTATTSPRPALPASSLTRPIR